jgi:hypothetical protein
MIPGLFQSLAAVFAVGIYAANIGIALGVYQDAHRLQHSAPGGLKVFSPGGWAMVCLFTSVPALAVYWAAHHSSLAK